eukprot:TRINITY_DN7945_c0_g1_i3.p1 TRINITY_DN7945_c0_g1~~TRINITY_DN7945_c0_g1_i3.p1  ORF type:complete len:442 (+),score=75.68 TRINITY_DN7945_c0_g1_i3:130-1455(+)
MLSSLDRVSGGAGNPATVISQTKELFGLRGLGLTSVAGGADDRSASSQASPETKQTGIDMSMGTGLMRSSPALHDRLGHHAPRSPCAASTNLLALTPAGNSHTDVRDGPAGVATPGAPAAPLTDVDMTVMAYAQWLSDVKQQAASARYHQQAELRAMQDAIGAQSGELAEFKRHSTLIVQQLQSQVSELRVKVSELSAELQARGRQHAEHEHTVPRTSTEALAASTLREEHSTTRQNGHAASDASRFQAALESIQEQTLMKFGEVDKAMTVLHGNSTNLQKELHATAADCKKGQDLLGKAIETLSQDFADFQKHSTNIMNKSQSDVHYLQELSRVEAERLSKVEIRLNALHQTAQSNTNELILLTSERSPAQSLGRATSPLPRASIRTSGPAIFQQSSAEGQMVQSRYQQACDRPYAGSPHSSQVRALSPLGVGLAGNTVW